MQLLADCAGNMRIDFAYTHLAVANMDASLLHLDDHDRAHAHGGEDSSATSACKACLEQKTYGLHTCIIDWCFGKTVVMPW